MTLSCVYAQISKKDSSQARRKDCIAIPAKAQDIPQSVGQRTDTDVGSEGKRGNIETQVSSPPYDIGL